MSIFLPDGFDQATPTGVTEFTPASQQTTQEDVALMQRVFGAAAANPLMLPPDFMSYILDYIQTSRLIIPIGQVFGFVQYMPGFTSIETEQSTTSISFTDLGMTGPEVDGLVDGQFIALWGASCFTSDATKQALVALSVNGVTDTTIYTECQGGSPVSVARGTVLTLANGGSNSVKCMYASGDAASTASFRHRWLILLRVSK